MCEDRIWESCTFHLLIHPVDALAKLTPVVKVSHRPSDARIPGESCRPNVVEAHETGETTRALHLQSILEELDSNVIATDRV